MVGDIIIWMHEIVSKKYLERSLYACVCLYRFQPNEIFMEKMFQKVQSWWGVKKIGNKKNKIPQTRWEIEEILYET